MAEQCEKQSEGATTEATALLSSDSEVNHVTTRLKRKMRLMLSPKLQATKMRLCLHLCRAMRHHVGAPASRVSADCLQGRARESVRTQNRANHRLAPCEKIQHGSAGTYLTIAVASIILEFPLVHPTLALRPEVERGGSMLSSF